MKKRFYAQRDSLQRGVLFSNQQIAIITDSCYNEK